MSVKPLPLSDAEGSFVKSDLMAEAHHSSAQDTPFRKDAFELSEQEKIAQIEAHFASIMDILGLDLTDDSLRGTPKRVAKMFVKEVFSGLDPRNFPEITLFDNNYGYDQMVVERDIECYSYCEHHFVPIIGKASVAYFSSGKVVGLSKLNRLVQHFGKRPQVQERLTMQIGKKLQEVLATEDVAVLIDASHLCVAMRGVEDSKSSTVTAFYGGKFQEEDRKKEFLAYLNL